MRSLSVAANVNRSIAHNRLLQSLNFLVDTHSDSPGVRHKLRPASAASFLHIYTPIILPLFLFAIRSKGSRSKIIHCSATFS